MRAIDDEPGCGEAARCEAAEAELGGAMCWGRLERG